jgi:DNA (cytosine-5)-methyltransferase 1
VNGISLFSNVGISETYLGDSEFNIVGANEILPDRAHFYQDQYPNSNMVCGDFSDPLIRDKLYDLYKDNDCEFIISTPPCQGITNAGKRIDNHSKLNYLSKYLIDFIKRCEPRFVLVENVRGYLNTVLNVDGKDITIDNLFKRELMPLGYFIKREDLDASRYGTAQKRVRTILMITKNFLTCFPNYEPIITLRDVIGDLPSLEAGEDSGILHHKAVMDCEEHINVMKHTPTGCSAFDNPPDYRPKRLDGSGDCIRFGKSFTRLDWDKPCATVLTSNGNIIGSSCSVHPGRKLTDGIWSDARVLTNLELFRVTGLPDNWQYPDWVSYNLLRTVIGECFLPKLALRCMKALTKEG